MHTLLPLSALTGFLVYYYSYYASFLISRKRNNTIGEPTSQEEHSPEETVKKNGRAARIFIPNVLARWPWHRRINPNYTMLKRDADAWIKSFQAFSPKAQETFDRCEFSLLASLAYPAARKEHARAGCDLINVLFLFDEYSDRSTPSEVRKQKDAMMDALRSPLTQRPKGEWVGGEAVRQFWARTIQHATAVSQKRFIQSMDEYLESIVQESVDKKDRRILDIKSYIDARRLTGAVKPSFCIIELGFDIPDEVMSHPALQEMILTAVDIICLCNDIYSFNVEQLREDDLYNIITCVMHEYHTDVNGAMLWIEDFLSQAVERFHASRATLPQWEEPLNSQIREYCDGLGQWVRANDVWSFESERYFGARGAEIKEKRWMSLLPRQKVVEIGPVQIDSSLL